MGLMGVFYSQWCREYEVGRELVEEFRCGLFAEQAEDTAAAAAHGGIHGSTLVEILLDGGYRGVLGEDAPFEVVLHEVGPLANGAQYARSQGMTGRAGTYAGVCLTGGDEIVGFDKHEIHSAEDRKSTRLNSSHL